MPERLNPAVYHDVVRRALAEDVGPGDVTTWAVVPAAAQATGTMLAKTTCVLAGLDLARDVCELVDATLRLFASLAYGDGCHAGEPIARIEGPAGSILTAERTALNFLQHLSGVATLTRRYVDAASGALTILDTRKTTPLL